MGSVTPVRKAVSATEKSMPATLGRLSAGAARYMARAAAGSPNIIRITSYNVCYTKLLRLLPLTSAAKFGGLGLICGVLLAAGLATRVAAIALMLLTFGVAMTSVWDNVYAYWLALFALLALYGPGRLSIDVV